MRADAHGTPSVDLVLLNLDSTQKGASGAAFPVVTPTPRLAKAHVEPPPFEALPIADPAVLDADGSSNPADSGDPSERALMAGRYRSQISARIERAWVRPRTPVTDGSAQPLYVHAPAGIPFVCQADIRQDARGNVQEVLLLACNGTEAWQHSLVVAIDQSSPLPAPPIPAVFASDVILTFVEHAYGPGDPADQYERPTREMASNAWPATAVRLVRDASAPSSRRSPARN